MKQLFFILLLLSATTTNPAAAELQVKLESPLSLGDQEKEWCNSSPEDSMVLTIIDGQKPPITLRVCSSYGDAKAKAFTDKKGRNYVLLEYGENRGTNARNDYLRVYRLDNDHLFKIMDIQLSWWTAPLNRFFYHYDVTTGHTAGLEINLRETGYKSGPDVPEAPDPECCIPSERTRTIWIDPEQ